MIVVIVEDDEASRALMVAVLASEYELRVAVNANEARQAFKQAPRPDLVLLDIVLGRGQDSGYEILQYPELQGIPVIAVSAYGGSNFESGALALGAVDFIHKPFEPSVLRARVAARLKKQ